jgi:hypothetical protein
MNRTAFARTAAFLVCTVAMPAIAARAQSHDGSCWST